jgi:predicted lipoprotein with Yx(FWY)xxD motif
MNRRLSIPILAVIVAGAVAVIVSTSGASTKKTPAVPATSAVSLKQTSVGKVLVDANGRTLYLFAADTANVSKLSAAGQAVWPPFIAATPPKATGGVSAGQIGTVTGSNQVTYNGHPLYYFVGDKSPGQTNGQGLNEFGARWYALSGAGTAVTSTPKAAPASSSTGTSSTPSYGY